MKTLLAAITVLVPTLSFASPVLPPSSAMPLNQISTRFSSSPETSVIQWGCPVSDIIHPANRVEGLERIKQECIAEATRAASAKPGVFDVIKAEIVARDMKVNGDHYQGTFFVETLVFQQPEAH